MATKSPQLGWQCKTTIPIGQFQLRLATNKTSRGLSSRATCHKLDGNFETHRMFHDYSREWIHSNPARVTEKVVDQQHQVFETMLESIKKDVAEWYKQKNEPLEEDSKITG